MGEELKRTHTLEGRLIVDQKIIPVQESQKKSYAVEKEVWGKNLPGAEGSP